MKSKDPSSKKNTNKSFSANNDLDNFILDTNSLTLFLNYQYLHTFYKIFENFFERSSYLKYYFNSPSPQRSEQRNQQEKTANFNNISAIPINQTVYSDIKNITLNEPDVDLSLGNKKAKFKLLLNVVDIK